MNDHSNQHILMVTKHARARMDTFVSNFNIPHQHLFKLHFNLMTPRLTSTLNSPQSQHPLVIPTQFHPTAVGALPFGSSYLDARTHFELPKFRGAGSNGVRVLFCIHSVVESNATLTTCLSPRASANDSIRVRNKVVSYA